MSLTLAENASAPSIKSGYSFSIAPHPAALIMMASTSSYGKCSQILPRHIARRIAQPGVVGQRAATDLVVRNDNVVTRGIEQPDGRTIDGAQHGVHDTAGKEGNGTLLLSFRADSGCRVQRPARIELRHQRFAAAIRGEKRLSSPVLRTNALQTRMADTTQKREARWNRHGYGKTCFTSAAQSSGRDAASTIFAAHVFHHVAELHPDGQAVSQARQSRQRNMCSTKESVICGAAFVKGPHEVDAAARGIHFVAEHAISRARRQAQAAMNAIEIRFVLIRPSPGASRFEVSIPLRWERVARSAG